MFDLRTSARAIGAAALLLSAVSAQDPERHTLRFTYAKDAVTWHRMSSVTVMKTEIEIGRIKQQVDSNVAVEMTLLTKIIDVLPDGTAKLERTVKRLKTKLVNPMMGGESSYDSDVKGSVAGPMADMATLVGVKLTMEMDTRGHVSRIKFPPEFEDQLSGRVALAEVEKEFANQYSLQLPEQPVAIGEVWKTETALALGGGMEVKVTVENKLLSHANGLATIEQKASYGEAQELKGPRGEMLKVIGKPSEGRVELDLKAGNFEKLATRMKMNINGEGVNVDGDVDMKLERIEEPKPAGGEGAGDPAKKAGGGE